MPAIGPDKKLAASITLSPVSGATSSYSRYLEPCGQRSCEDPIQKKFVLICLLVMTVATQTTLATGRT